MKATIDVPDELYRKVKAKSALEGRPVREVTVELFRGWVGETHRHEENSANSVPDPARPSWFGSLRRYARNAHGNHDMNSVGESVARGRGEGWAKKEDVG